MIGTILYNGSFFNLIKKMRKMSNPTYDKHPKSQILLGCLFFYMYFLIYLIFYFEYRHYSTHFT